MKESNSLESACGCWHYKVSKETCFEIDSNRARKLSLFSELCEIYTFSSMGKKCVYMYYFYFHFDQKTVNETTVESVSGNLLNISRRAKEYTDPLDVVYTADIVKNLAQVIGGDKKVRRLWVFLFTFQGHPSNAFCTIVFTVHIVFLWEYYQ